MTSGVIAGWLRPHISEGGELLDVGGGTGALASKLGDALGARATVLDPTPQMLRYATGDRLAAHGARQRRVDAVRLRPVRRARRHRRVPPLPRPERSGHRVRPRGSTRRLCAHPRPRPAGLLHASHRRRREAARRTGAFFTPDELCDYMASRGIRGECAPGRGAVLPVSRRRWRGLDGPSRSRGSRRCARSRGAVRARRRSSSGCAARARRPCASRRSSRSPTRGAAAPLGSTCDPGA